MATEILELDDDGDLMIWQVRYSNYDPPEIDSLWLYEKDARTRASTLKNGDWVVEPTWVKGSQ